VRPKHVGVLTTCNEYKEIDLIYLNSYSHLSAIHFTTFVSNTEFQGCHDNYQCLGFEFLTVADMNSSVSWDITLCNPFETKRRFEGTYLLYLQG
jgi:hypothetical protein